MTTLNNLNCYLDEDFERNFVTEEYIEVWEDEHDILEYFDNEFEERYNSDIYCFHEEAKDLLGFDEAMEVCRYVDDHYEGWSAPSSDFGDEMLKMYIYFYMVEKHKGEFIEKIKNIMNLISSQKSLLKLKAQKKFQSQSQSHMHTHRRSHPCRALNDNANIFFDVNPFYGGGSSEN